MPLFSSGLFFEPEYCNTGSIAILQHCNTVVLAVCRCCRGGGGGGRKLRQAAAAAASAGFSHVAAVTMVRSLLLHLISADGALQQQQQRVIRVLDAEMRAQMDARALEQRAVINEQQAVTDELRTQIADVNQWLSKLQESAQERRSLEAGAYAHAALASDSDGSSGGATCAEPSGPKLQVDGVCSCMLIGDRSLAAELGNLTAAVEAR